MVLDVYEYYKMVKTNNVDIVYSGPIWANGIEQIADSLKKRLSYDNLPLAASKSVYSVFIEQLNNMLMYSTEKQILINKENELSEISCGIFVLSAKNKRYYLQSGNMMKEERVERLRNKIDYINTLNAVELKQYYKEQIHKENDIEDSKGAGIGLIEIARRASSKLKYDFKPLGGGNAFFSMTVEIGGGD
jgi:hypothetical protein